MLNLLYGPTLTSVHDYWKNHSLTIQIFVGKLMSPLFNMLFRFLIDFLPRSKHLNLKTVVPSAVILEPKKTKFVTPPHSSWLRASMPDAQTLAVFSVMSCRTGSPLCQPPASCSQVMVHAPGLVSSQSAFACLSTLSLLPCQLLKYALNHHIHVRFPGKESSCNVGDPGSVPGSGRSPGKRNGYPIQYSCLENSTDRVWQALVHGVAKSRTQLNG